jgi:hypothetical protein
MGIFNSVNEPLFVALPVYLYICISFLPLSLSNAFSMTFLSLIIDMPTITFFFTYFNNIGTPLSFLHMFILFQTILLLLSFQHSQTLYNLQMQTTSLSQSKLYTVTLFHTYKHPLVYFTKIRLLYFFSQ